jgi:hypothetical protein
MRRWMVLLMCILCMRVSLNFWLMIPETERKKIVLSVACEFAQKAGGKAVAFVCVEPKDWSVEVHAEIVEIGL